jgi:oxygen-dependent protoporphyrinogen oxidase
VTHTVVVVGGGITGLAAAHALTEGADPPAVVVLEGGDRLGGKIRTGDFAGLPVETGPDTILARVPWGLELCRRLGLTDQIVHPATGAAAVWARGRLRPLPDGLVLGVPAAVLPVARSGVLSPAGLTRAAADLVLPRRAARRDGDGSIAEIIGGRFGAEVVDRLVDPLLSGINAGRADRLSLEAAAPDIASVARSHRSLLLGLRTHRRRNPPDPTRPVFAGVVGGLSRLVDRLAVVLAERGVDIRLGAPVAHIEKGGPDGAIYDVHVENGPPLAADAVIVTTPAGAAGRALASLSAPAAAERAAGAYASVAVAT